MSTDHNTRILDQFTKTAHAFGAAPQLTDSESLDLLVRATNAASTDHSLDVACGAGVVACHFARKVRVAEGVDITPAMLDQARARQERQHLSNVRWTLADVAALPYGDAEFTIVTSRYAIHHMEAPSRVLGEMKRVCASEGRIAVADICLPNDREEAALFNRIERLNDPSHASALMESEWHSLFQSVGLAAPTVETYKLVFPLDRMLQAANRTSGEISGIESEVRGAAANGKLRGIAIIDGDTTKFGYPIAVFSVACRAA
jgi:SAM-dependent methyltransferase